MHVGKSRSCAISSYMEWETLSNGVGLQIIFTVLGDLQSH